MGTAAKKMRAPIDGLAYDFLDSYLAAIVGHLSTKATTGRKDFI